MLEGLALSADPDYRLLGRAYPYIARRLLTDPAPELRCAAPNPLSRQGCRRVFADHACTASNEHAAVHSAPFLSDGAV